MTGPALVVSDLEVRYGSVAAVRGVSFEVAPGEIVGLIGPNGAGKSSTLHAIMGLVRVSAGDVRLGDRVSPWTPAGGGRAERDRARPGRAADLRRAHRRREPPPRPLRTTLAGGCGRGRRPGRSRCSLSWPSSASATPERSPAVSSSSSRSPGRSSRPRRPPPRRAVARALADGHRRGVRGARGDPRAGHRRAPRRAARAAHGGAREPLARPRQRRGPPDAHPRRRRATPSA